MGDIAFLNEFNFSNRPHPTLTRSPLPRAGEGLGERAIGIISGDQWRVCFIWNQGHVEQIEIVDYH